MVSAKMVANDGHSDLEICELRHAHASFAIKAGSSLRAIGENLGHARASITERYAHLLLDARRPVSEVAANAYKGTTAANRMGFEFRSLLQHFRSQGIAQSRTVKAAPA